MTKDLKKLLAKITPGPWSAEQDEDGNWPVGAITGRLSLRKAQRTSTCPKCSVIELETEIARLSMILAAKKAWIEGEPSNPPKTGVAKRNLTDAALNPTGEA